MWASAHFTGLGFLLQENCAPITHIQAHLAGIGECKVTPCAGAIATRGSYGAYLPHSLGGSGRCSLDGAEMGCAFVESLRSSGATEDCPDNDCSKRNVTVILTFKDGHKKTFSGFVDLFLAPYNGTTTVVGRAGHWGGEMFYGRMLDGESFQDAYKSALYWSAAALFSPGSDRSSFAEPQNPGTYATLDKDQTNVVTQAIKDGKNLTKDRACDEALKSFGIPSLAALISQLSPSDVYDAKRSTAGIPDNGRSTPANQYAKKYKEEVGAVVVVGDVGTHGDKNPMFLLDRFFNPASVDWISQQRAIIMLHEAVHKFTGKSDRVFGSDQSRA